MRETHNPLLSGWERAKDWLGLHGAEKPVENKEWDEAHFLVIQKVDKILLLLKFSKWFNKSLMISVS